MKLALFLLALTTSQYGAEDTHLLLLESDGEVITTVDREEFTLPLPSSPFIDTQALDIFMSELNALIYKEPKNAFIDDSGHIVKESLGFTLDQRSFQQQYYQYFYSQGAASQYVPKKPLYPLVDSELLSRIYSKPIGYYVTFFNSYNRARTNNIHLASQAIDNFVLFPGEIFSFNKVVGNRTKGNGYLPAPVIIRGELSEGIGGGICQVSSTLFNAVDRAGLKVLERYSHSKTVPYVPPGRDATVSWYGPDFTFRNNYSDPILIRSKVRGGSMSIVLYSSDEVESDLRSKN